MGVPLSKSHSRKMNKKLMERKGKKKSSVILGKGHGKKFFKTLFSYFIVLIVSRILGRFLLSVSLRLGYSADVSLSHCPLCVCVPLLNILLLMFRVSVKSLSVIQTKQN